MCKSQPTDDKLSLRGAWSGYVTHYKILGPNHITGTAEFKVVKFCTRVGYIKSMQQDDISPTKGRECFKILPFVVMQRVARVCQRQLSYLYIFVVGGRRASHFAHGLIVASASSGRQTVHERAWSESRNTFLILTPVILYPERPKRELPNFVRI